MIARKTRICRDRDGRGGSASGWEREIAQEKFYARPERVWKMLILGRHLDVVDNNGGHRTLAGDKLEPKLLLDGSED